MKKNFVFIAGLLLSGGIYAQHNLYDIIDPQHTGSQHLFNKGDAKKEYIQGSPYLNKTFSYAVITGISQGAPMRYNVADDEIEFQDSNDTTKVYILPKTDKYGTINFALPKQKMRFLNYDLKENKWGYLVEITSEKGVSLLRKDRITYYKARTPKNSYELAVPAKYEKEKSQYFLELKDEKIIPFPSNKKALQQAFPDHSEAIASFLKEKNYSFKEESDLKKITVFLSDF